MNLRLGERGEQVDQRFGPDHRIRTPHGGEELPGAAQVILGAEERNQWQVSRAGEVGALDQRRWQLGVFLQERLRQFSPSRLRRYSGTSQLRTASE